MKKMTYSLMTLVTSSILLAGSASQACGDFDLSKDKNKKFVQLVNRLKDSTLTCNEDRSVETFDGHFIASFPKCPNAKPILFLSNGTEISRVDHVLSNDHNSVEILTGGKVFRCYDY